MFASLQYSGKTAGSCSPKAAATSIKHDMNLKLMTWQAQRITMSTIDQGTKGEYSTGTAKSAMHNVVQ